MKLNSCFKIIFEKTVYVLLSKNTWLTFMLLPYFLFSCENTKTNTTIQEKEILYSEIAVDTVYLVKDDFSGIGFFQFSQGELYFVDQIFSTVSKYNTSGELIGTFLGKGDGPDMQNVINGFMPFVDAQSHMIVGGNETVLFDLDFSRQSSYPIRWDYSDNYSDMENLPKASMIGLYEIGWRPRGTNLSVLVDMDSKEMIFPVEMSHPKLNGFLHKEYYESVHTIGKYNMDRKKISAVLGHRSPVYLDHPFIPNFDFFYLESVSDSILVSFAVDPMIHVLDADGNLIGKFGFPGQDFKSNYPATSSIDDALANFEIDLNKAGFYDHIYYEKMSGYLFRSYFPEGKGKGYSRIQVFENHSLIADVQVPERFRVIGNSGDWFIADGILDEKEEEMAVYKFVLK